MCACEWNFTCPCCREAEREPEPELSEPAVASPSNEERDDGR